MRATMRTYRLRHRVSHAAVDFLGEMKVSALLGVLEQAGVEASTDAGFDPAWYTAANRMWVIHRTRLRRLVPVGGLDTLDLETQIADFRRARSLRRYLVRRGDTPVVTATTDWVFCDLTTGRPARIPESMQVAFGDGERAPILARLDRLPDHGPGEPVRAAVTVAPTHLDHIVHVNNAVYADFLENAAFALFAACGWPFRRMLEAGGALRIATLDIEYHSDSEADERLEISTWLDGESGVVTPAAPPMHVKLLQTITRSVGRDVLRARTEWVWREKPPVVGGVPRGS